MSRSSSEQTAGSGTAESDSPPHERTHGAASPDTATDTNVQGDHVDGTKSPPNITDAAAQQPRPTALSSPSKRGIFSKYKRSSSHDGISLSQSISNSAPTILIHTNDDSNNSNSTSNPLIQRPIVSCMSSRTLTESLHKGKSSTKGRPRSNSAKTMGCSVSFANVNIREYERILGDNPSVTSGPPLGIGWRHTTEPLVVNINDYEDGKGLPRASSEYLVPRAVRESLIRDHAGVSRREIATVVRTVNKEKAQRRKTVVNLPMQKTEERVEYVKRKMKKILKPNRLTSSSYQAAEGKLWDDAHTVAVEKAKRLEESIRRGESVGMKNVYCVGTPCGNILPSKKNSMRDMGVVYGDSLGETESEKGVEDTAVSAVVVDHDAALEPMAKQYTPKSANNPNLHQPCAGEPDAPHHVQTASVANKEGERPSREGPLRTSANIVASETDSEDILANLVLDDGGLEF